MNEKKLQTLIHFNLDSKFSVEILKKYKTIIPNQMAKEIDEDMETYLRQASNESLREYKFQYIAAVSFHDNGTILAWYNGQALHSAPLSLNLVHNAIIKAIFRENFGINVNNQPCEFYIDVIDNYESIGLEMTLFFNFVMPVLNTLYILFYIKVNFRMISIRIIGKFGFKLMLFFN